MNYRFNLDAIRTDSKMRRIKFKLNPNIIQKPDQQIKNWIKTRCNSDATQMQYTCNSDALDALQM